MSKGYKRARTDYPEGVVAIYDNDGKTTDRYLVVYEPVECQGERFFPTTCMSDTPYHPQGVCMHGEVKGHRPTGGWGTGQRVIAFKDLPKDCQRAVKQDLSEKTHGPGWFDGYDYIKGFKPREES